MNSDSNRKHVAETARFDDSFAAHMIRDFFLVLVAVVSIELSIRFALVVYDFHHNRELATQITRDLDLHAARFCETLEEMVGRTESLASRHDGLTLDLRDISGGLHEFRHFLEEMAVLEEKMRGIAAEGQTLLHRLRYVEASDAGDGAEAVGATS